MKVDFSSILTRKCSDSDYYDWTTLEKVGLNKVLSSSVTWLLPEDTFKGESMCV